jgi:hypothetical protein
MLPACAAFTLIMRVIEARPELASGGSCTWGVPASADIPSVPYAWWTEREPDWRVDDHALLIRLAYSEETIRTLAEELAVESSLVLLIILAIAGFVGHWLACRAQEILRVRETSRFPGWNYRSNNCVLYR